MARKRKKIQKIKKKLEAGKFSPEQAEQKREAIREMGGKVRKDLGEPELAPPLQGPGLSPPLQGDPGGYPAPEYPTDLNKLRLGRPQGIFDADVAAEEAESRRQVELANPNISGPFGGQTVTFDAEGRPTVNQDLSPGQQGILDRETGLSTGGLDAALNLLGQGGQQFDPTLTDRTMSGDLLADRQRIEEDVFGRLTRDLDEQRSKALEDTERTLYNRGIPLDPANPQYAKAMEQVNQRFDEQSQAARQTATQMGGQEFARSFGIGEQLRANELSEQAGIHGQRLGDIGFYGNLGPGLRTPSFQGYQGPNYDVADPSSLFFGAEALRQGKGATPIQKKQYEDAMRQAWEKLGQGQQALDIASRPAAPAGPALPPSPFG